MERVVKMLRLDVAAHFGRLENSMHEFGIGAIFDYVPYAVGCRLPGVVSGLQ